jgi:hypothetical protein
LEQLFATPAHPVGDKYHERPDAGRMLVSQGFAREIPPEPLAPAVVSWGVLFDSFGVPSLVGNCSRGNCGVYRFLGHPENAAKWPFIHSGGCGMPTPVPPEVVEQYRRAYGSATPKASGDDTKVIKVRQYSDAIDRAADASFQRLYGRPRK